MSAEERLVQYQGALHMAQQKRLLSGVGIFEADVSRPLIEESRDFRGKMNHLSDVFIREQRQQLNSAHRYWNEFVEFILRRLSIDLSRFPLVTPGLSSEGRFLLLNFLCDFYGRTHDYRILNLNLRIQDHAGMPPPAASLRRITKGQALSTIEELIFCFHYLTTRDFVALERRSLYASEDRSPVAK